MSDFDPTASKDHDLARQSDVPDEAWLVWEHGEWWPGANDLGPTSHRFVRADLVAERDAEIERLRSDNATLRTAFAVAEDQSAHSVSLVEGLEADRDALRDQLEQSHAGRGDEGPGMIATTADLGPPVPEYTITITVKEYIRLRMTAEKSVQRKIALRQLNAAHGVACLTMRLMAHQLNDASARLRGEKP